MLRPPPSSLARMPCSTRSRMSRKAVSGEHFSIVAHLLDVSLPSKPSNSRFSMSRCRSLIRAVACRFQKSAFSSTAARMVSAPLKARSRQPRNQLKPRCHVEVALLGALQHVIVGFPLAAYLGGHAVEALR